MVNEHNSALTAPASQANWFKRILSIPGFWRDRVDWKYGVDTSGEIPPEELRVDSPNAAFSKCYRPTLGWVIRLFIRQLPLDLSQYQFVDFGSGKGRALLVASEFSFPRIVGVEFCQDLHEVAVKNIALLPGSRRGNSRVVSILQDATQFELPKSNLVCYLYNSFGPPVLDDVLKKMIDHRREGFDVYLIYINPKHRDVVHDTGSFQQIFAHRKGIVLRVFP